MGRDGHFSRNHPNRACECENVTEPLCQRSEKGDVKPTNNNLKTKEGQFKTKLSDNQSHLLLPVAALTHY